MFLLSITRKRKKKLYKFDSFLFCEFVRIRVIGITSSDKENKRIIKQNPHKLIKVDEDFFMSIVLTDH